MSSKLSIIIPVYNTEEYVEGCLDSIFAQTYPNIEVILVNNGSSGNIEEIYKKYRAENPTRELKLVSHKDNQGTFHGRGSGMALATGDYFTFMDADDRVGVDFYRQLIETSQENNAEITVADMVHEDENGRQFRYIEDPVRYIDFNLKGNKEVFDFYYRFSGLSYSMYGIWNKIYKRELWDRCSSFIEQITEHFALCEDAVYTTIFFSMAESAVNIHDQYYYHFVRSDSSSGSLTATKEKIMRNVGFLATAFNNMGEHLKRAGKYEQYEKCYEEFRLFHLKTVIHQIENGSYSFAQKEYLRKYCLDKFGVEDISKLTDDEMYYTNTYVEQSGELENLYQEIASDKYEVVCFDVFGTFVQNPFYSENDLFKYMQSDFNKLGNWKVSFEKIRTESEYRAHRINKDKTSFYECVNLDDVYAEMRNLISMDENQAQELKQLEIKLRTDSGRIRKCAKNLYDVAVRKNKKIILIADSALHKDDVDRMLNRLGYESYSKLLVSGEEHLSKAKGSLYRLVAKENKGRILFIGDQYFEDCVVGRKYGLTCLHLPNTREVALNKSDKYYGGDTLGTIFTKQNLQENKLYGSLLSMLADKEFDTPFALYDRLSDFNGNAYFMGYRGLGAYVYAVSNMLFEELKGRNLHSIVIVGVKNSIFAELIKKIANNNKYELEVSVKDIGNCYLDDIPSNLTFADLRVLYIKKNIGALSPGRIIEFVKDSLDAELTQDLDKFYKENNIIPDTQFQDAHMYEQFVDSLKPFWKGADNKIAKQKEEAVFYTGLNQVETHSVNIDEYKYKFCIFSTYADGEICFDSRLVDSTYKTVMHYLLLNDTCDDFVVNVINHRLIIKGINDFADDYINVVNNGLIYNKDLFECARYLLDKLIVNGKYNDRRVLFGHKTSDNSDVRLSDMWATIVTEVIPEKRPELFEKTISYTMIDNRFKRIMYMLLFDHDKLKEVIADIRREK